MELSFVLKIFEPIKLGLLGFTQREHTLKFFRISEIRGNEIVVVHHRRYSVISKPSDAGSCGNAGLFDESTDRGFARAIGAVEEIYRLEIGDIFGLGGAVRGDTGKANRLDHVGASVQAGPSGWPLLSEF